jgi:putative ABC transport system permease protein
MLIIRFITRSIWYFRKQHLALFAGTVIATAALTGALMLGDSVRYSLVSLVDLRLGKTGYVITSGPRFMRSQLAGDMGSTFHASAASLLIFRGMAIHSGTDLRLNSVQVVGIDSCFSLFPIKKLPVLEPGEALLSANTATRLDLKIGDMLLLRVETMDLIPRNAIFSPEKDGSAAIRLTVAGITNDSTLGRFSLRNNQMAPFNIFISREFLAHQLQLDSLSNAILLAANPKNELQASEIRSVLKSAWQLQDASLRISKAERSDFYDLASTRVFVDDTVAAILSEHQLPYTKILTYLVNHIQLGRKQTPYSFVTASSSSLVSQNPGNGVVINRWLADDLNAHPGDTMEMGYFIMGPLRNLSTSSSEFVITKIIPNDSSMLARNLMPAIPGLSEAGSCRDWNSGVPIDFKQIRDKDEKYWNEYKGSPKAYISYEAGKAIWNNNFGNCTALRFNSRDITPDSLKSIVLSNLDPGDVGIELIPIRQAGQFSAYNSVDFGQLFLYLSFFIITGGLVLIILIHALNSETRTRESAVLAGLGFNRRMITGMRIKESLPVLLAGGFAGALTGIVYNYGLLAGLNLIWNHAVHTDTLMEHIRPGTFFIGAASGIVLSLATTTWVTWKNLNNPVSGLLKDYRGNMKSTATQGRNISGPAGFTLAGISIALVAYSLMASLFQHAGLFLLAGGLSLAGCIFIFDHFVRRSVQQKIPGMNIRRMAVINAGRNRGRSLAVIIILSLGVFAVMITGSYRRTFYGTEDLLKSGTGGYRLWAETTLSLAVDLNSPEGRNKLNLENENDLDRVHFIQLHALEGDDASCLNLNQVQKPRILGIPVSEFAGRNAFSFVTLVRGIDRRNPWAALGRYYGHNTYPAYADQTVIQYGLKKHPGDTLNFVNEKGKPFRIVLAGGLDNSIFQGSILVDEKVLLSQFPSLSGSKVILAEVPQTKQEQVVKILSNSLPDFGIDATSTSARLAVFNTVENAYLSVFMMLGGLGLLIGTVGLALVLLRNMLERRYELGLLTAIGFGKKDLIRLVFTEYFFLLLVGVLCGALSAFIAIMPSWLSPEFTLHAGFLAMLILAIVCSGSLWIYLGVRLILKQNLLAALKED